MHAIDTLLKDTPAEVKKEVRYLCRRHEEKVDAALACKTSAAACKADATAWVERKAPPPGLTSAAPKTKIQKSLLLQPVDETMTTLRAFIATMPSFQNEDGTLKQVTVEGAMDVMHSKYVATMLKIRVLATTDYASKVSSDLGADGLLNELGLLAAELNGKATAVFGADAPAPVSQEALDRLKTAASAFHQGLVAKKAATAWSAAKAEERRSEQATKARDLAANMTPDKAMHTAVVQSTIHTLRQAGHRISSEAESKILSKAMTSDPPGISKNVFGAGDRGDIADLVQPRGRRRNSSASRGRRGTRSPTPTSRSASKRRSDSSESRPSKRFRSLSAGKGKGRGKGRGRGRGAGRGRGKGKGRGE